MLSGSGGSEGLILKVVFLPAQMESIACSCCCVVSVVSNSVRPHRRPRTRLPRPWDCPGKNTGVGCHFLLQWMKVESESKVAQLCPTLSDPMDLSLPGSSVHGIFQARALEWGAIVAAAQIKPELLCRPSHTPATAHHCTPSPARLHLPAGTLTLHPGRWGWC